MLSILLTKKLFNKWWKRRCNIRLRLRDWPKKFTSTIKATRLRLHSCRLSKAYRMSPTYWNSRLNNLLWSRNKPRRKVVIKVKITRNLKKTRKTDLKKTRKLMIRKRIDLKRTRKQRIRRVLLAHQLLYQLQLQQSLLSQISNLPNLNMSPRVVRQPMYSTFTTMVATLSLMLLSNQRNLFLAKSISIMVQLALYHTPLIQSLFLPSRLMSNQFNHPLNSTLDHSLDNLLKHPMNHTWDNSLDNPLKHPLNRTLEHSLDNLLYNPLLHQMHYHLITQLLPFKGKSQGQSQAQ